MTIIEIATVTGVIVSLLTLLQSANEYIRQGAIKRAEHFIEIRKRLKENATFKMIADLTERNDPELMKIPFKDKRDYLGLFEEVAIAMNSGLIRKHVAHYMFGYYAIRCWESTNFWSDVNRNSFYWTLFKDFAEQMKKIEAKFKYRRKNYVF